MRTLTTGCACLAVCTVVLVCGSTGSSGSTGRAVLLGGSYNQEPAPPAALTAASLMSPANLSSAMGTPISGIQDDGGVSNSQGALSFESQAETATSDANFAITLTSYGSDSVANQAYTTDLSQYGNQQALPGVGTQASIATNPLLSVCENESPSVAPAVCGARLRAGGGSALTGQPVTVLKGAQVLTVTPTPAAAVKTQFANDETSATQPGTFEQLIALAKTVLITQPTAMATALAGRMTGQTSTKRYLEVPHGAINACLVPASKLAGKGLSVTASNVPSDMPPEQECRYTVNGDEFGWYSETSAQAADSVPPASLQQIYATAAQNATEHEQVNLKHGVTAEAFAVGGDLFETGVLLTSNGSGGDPGLLTIFEPFEGASAGETITKNDCELIIAALPKDYVNNYPSALEGNAPVPTNVSRHILAWCLMLALHPLAPLGGINP
jgi:hypothetical protein